MNQISPEDTMITIGLYELFFERSLNGLLFINQDGNILKANATACNIFGYTAAELQQMDRKALIDSSDPALAKLAAPPDGSDMRKGVITGIRKNGEKFPLKIVSVVLQDPGHEAVTCATVIDISEEKDQEKKLQLLL